MHNTHMQCALSEKGDYDLALRRDCDVGLRSLGWGGHQNEITIASYVGSNSHLHETACGVYLIVNYAINDTHNKPPLPVAPQGHGNMVMVVSFAHAT